MSKVDDLWQRLINIDHSTDDAIFDAIAVVYDLAQDPTKFPVLNTMLACQYDYLERCMPSSLALLHCTYPIRHMLPCWRDAVNWLALDRTLQNDPVLLSLIENLGTDTSTELTMKDLCHHTTLSHLSIIPNPDNYDDVMYNHVDIMYTICLILDDVSYIIQGTHEEYGKDRHNGPVILQDDRYPRERLFTKPIPVICKNLSTMYIHHCDPGTRWSSDSNYDNPEQEYCSDVLQILNAQTGECILEIGTGDIDNLYPSFICNFSAESIGSVES